LLLQRKQMDILKMPRPCAVECDAVGSIDVAKLPGGVSHLLLITKDLVAEASNKRDLHGTRPWHAGFVPTLFVATNVNLHGTRPWGQPDASAQLAISFS
jgi:hypothetical protein